ncbi:MAG: nucleoside monophosphate kinase [Candidatus Peribacteraceae bacterium]|nr:nucleoside monophosphate kinase [Candidatus Peribacteraceae bacterium]
MDLVFFGIQGSGKGTQAKRLAAEFGYDIFEAGGELRKIAATDSPLAEKVKSFMHAGNLVPHEIIMQVVKEAIAKRPSTTKILFDGIPRDSEQMKDFNQIMNDAKREFRCIEFTLSKEEAVKRILGRAKAEGRADDANIEIITRRMETFLTKTRPVIEVYRMQGKLKEIDADRSVAEIYGELKKVIGVF